MHNVDEQEYNEYQKKWLEDQGYYNVSILADGLVANYDFMYTTACIVDIGIQDTGTRFCYPDREKARQLCLSMQSIDDKPLSGMSAVKGRRVDVNGDNIQEYLKRYYK